MSAFDYTTAPADPIGVASFAQTGGAPTGIAPTSFVQTTDDAGLPGAPESHSLPIVPATFKPAFIEIDSGGARLQLLNANAGDLNRILQGTVGGQLVNYQVRAGTDAEDLPGIVHPANYNADTNAFVFVQL